MKDLVITYVSRARASHDMPSIRRPTIECAHPARLSIVIPSAEHVRTPKISDGRLKWSKRDLWGMATSHDVCKDHVPGFVSFRDCMNERLPTTGRETKHWR